MKTLKQILFLATVVIGFSISASAQKNDQDKKPPKDPPVIKPSEKPPREKPPREKPPNNDNRGGKKPQIVFIKSGTATTIYFS